MHHPEIYLVRHGETEWNRSRRYQGQLDSRLTENGIRQAAYVGNLISKIIPNLEDIPFYCSPLGRCRETAARICNAAAVDPKKLIYEDHLMEIHCGHWQTWTRKEVAKRWPNEVAAYKANIWNYEIPGGGENCHTLQNRARRWLHTVREERRALVVSHGMIGRIIRGLCCSLAPKEVLALEVPQGVVYHLKDGVENIFPKTTKKISKNKASQKESVF